MTDTKEIADRSADLAADLRRFRLDTRPYLRGPIATELFAIGIEDRQVRPWTGLADVQVTGDRKRRQAILNITEGRREITRTYNTWLRKDTRGGTEQQVEATKDQLLARFPVRVPNAVVSDYKVKRQLKGNLCEVEVTVTAAPSHLTLLTGFDEIRQFVAAIPKRVITVEDAHRALRPGNLSKRAVRQGEWFFDPVSAHEEILIEKAFKRGARSFRTALENGSTHTAETMLVDGVTYAKGLVRDSRTDRHHPIELVGWHRIVRNLEVVIPSGAGRPRTTTWD